MRTSPPFAIATNNGSIGGGEVMLLNIAEALRSLDVPVSVVAPIGRGETSQLADAARERGFPTVALPAASRGEWMRRLREWDRHHRSGVLWCNGLVPAAATAGHQNRIVHLHQRPRGTAQRALYRLARARALRVLVPSSNMRADLAGTEVLENWCDDITIQRRAANEPYVIGFLGRPSTDKGVEVLVDAIIELDRRNPGAYRLALAGTAKFVERSAVSSVEQALHSVDHLVDRLGWVARDTFFGSIDVLAVPSLWQEPFGLVAAEAMAAGVPAVVSDAGALPDVVGPDGWITPAGDVKRLTDALEAILQNRHDASNRVSALRSRWETQFSPDAGRKRVEQLLASLTR